MSDLYAERKPSLKRRAKGGAVPDHRNGNGKAPAPFAPLDVPDDPHADEDRPPLPDAPDEAATNLTQKLANAITTEHYFAQDSGGKLYVFRDGVYTPEGEAHVKRCVKALTIAWEENWTANRAKETCEYIRVDAPLLWTQPPLDTLNVLNGLLDWKAKSLRPHSPEFLSPVQLPIRFDPDATCPNTEKFIEETFPEDARSVAFEIHALLMVPGIWKAKTILLQGEGANGKSVYLAAVRAFIGRENTSTLSLQKLSADRFAVSRIIGKLANICPDIPSTHLEDTSVFKAVTGDDPIDAEYKFRDGFSFNPFARLVFSCNHLPRSSDASKAFFRRWLVIPFTRTFEEGTPGVLSREELDARLADPKELSGVLNRALEVLPEVLKRGVAETKSMRDAWREFRHTTDPLSVWLDRNIVQHASAVVPKGDLYRAYTQACEQSGRPSPSDKAFSKALKETYPGLDDGQRRTHGKPEWCWLGIGMKTSKKAEEQASQGGEQPSPGVTGVTAVTRSSLFYSNAQEDEGEGETESEKREESISAEAVTAVTAVTPAEARQRVFDLARKREFPDAALPSGRTIRPTFEAWRVFTDEAAPEDLEAAEAILTRNTDAQS